jgi:hypothetical protein
MNKSLVTLIAAALLSSTGAFAQTVCEQCGPLPPPPAPVTCSGKSNAGVGNGGDGARTELNDCDPGKSGLHNQAAKNADRPHGRR